MEILHQLLKIAPSILCRCCRNMRPPAGTSGFEVTICNLKNLITAGGEVRIRTQVVTSSQGTKIQD